MKTQTQQPLEFCKYCGRQLVEQEPITADHFGGRSYFKSPFDSTTGRKRMRKWIACPRNVRPTWWEKFQCVDGRHDAHAIGEEYLV